MADTVSEAQARMNKAVVSTSHELAGVRTGRASASILDRVIVDYYGTKTPLKQVANISVPEAQLIIIQPWDKSVMGAVEKAIINADLGLNPSNDGQVIRLPFPPLTEDRRREMVKLVKNYCEEGKVAVRNIRRDANEDLKMSEKSHDITEDDLEDDKHSIQKFTDKAIAEIDELFKVKEKELLEI